MNMSKF